MAREIIKLTESNLRRMIMEVIENTDAFKPHGYKTISNSGGRMIQLSDSGDAARIKYEDGTVSDWMEIEYVNDDETDDTRPMVNGDRGSDYIDDYMRY